MNSQNEKTYLGHFYVVLSTFGFSLVPILAAFSLNQGMNSETMLTYRFLIAGTFFLAYAQLKQISLRMDLKKGLKLFGMGLLYALECTFFFEAFKYISPSLGQLLFQVNPLMVALGAFLIFKERITKNVIIALGLTSVGCVLLFWEPTVQVTPLGLALVLLAALFYATYIILGKEMLKDIEPMVVTTYTTVGCGVFLLGYSLIAGKMMTTHNPQIIGAIITLAVLSTIVSILTFALGLKRLGATKASIISSLEPVFTGVLAFFFMNEKLSVLQLVGGILIVLSILIVEMKDNSKQQEIEMAQVEKIS